MKNRKIANVLLITAMIGIYMFASQYIILNYSGILKYKWIPVVFWILTATMSIGSVIAFSIYWLDPKDVPLKNARVVAIVPVFNEEPELLQQTIESLLNQDMPVEKIHVVDDGSTIPVTRMEDSRIVYYRQKNSGKRYAQKRVIDALNREDVDFILTVDSDSQIEPQALRKLLTAFKKDKNLMVCTGTVLTSNFRENLMTRIADMNIGISCLIARPIRSMYGALETTSGALALYKKEIFFDNLQDYVTSGTYSDDRRLCTYGVLQGNAIGVTEATVLSSMPTTFRDTWRQRLRWGKGSWKAFPFQVVNYSPIKLFFPFIAMAQVMISPLFLIVIIYAFFTGYFFYALTYMGIHLAKRYVQSAIYLLSRPGMTGIEKFWVWLFVTPFEFLYTFFILVAVKYVALFHLNESGWLTRK